MGETLAFVSRCGLLLTRQLGMFVGPPAEDYPNFPINEGVVYDFPYPFLMMWNAANSSRSLS